MMTFPKRNDLKFQYHVKLWPCKCEKGDRNPADEAEEICTKLEQNCLKLNSLKQFLFPVRFPRDCDYEVE